MLDPESVDLDGLGAALDDRTAGTAWCLDPATGALVATPADGPVPDGLLRVEPAGSHAGYQDMAQFVAAVHHRRAAGLLDRAISGRGAFRRFKDTLGEFPELREQWFRYRDARARRRAAVWLADRGLVERAAVDRLAPEQADTWLAALNDVRLALGTALDVSEDMPDQLDPDDPRSAHLGVYQWLTFVQDSLVQARMQVR